MAINKEKTEGGLCFPLFFMCCFCCCNPLNQETDSCIDQKRGNILGFLFHPPPHLPPCVAPCLVQTGFPVWIEKVEGQGRGGRYHIYIYLVILLRIPMSSPPSHVLPNGVELVLGRVAASLPLASLFLRRVSFSLASPTPLSTASVQCGLIHLI